MAIRGGGGGDGVSQGHDKPCTTGREALQVALFQTPSQNEEDQRNHKRRVDNERAMNKVRNCHLLSAHTGCRVPATFLQRPNDRQTQAPARSHPQGADPVARS
jgi:hypothetical protein